MPPDNITDEQIEDVVRQLEEMRLQWRVSIQAAVDSVRQHIAAKMLANMPVSRTIH